MRRFRRKRFSRDTGLKRFQLTGAAAIGSSVIVICVWTFIFLKIISLTLHRDRDLENISSAVRNRPSWRMMQFMLLFSRQGKLRLQKWYVAHPDKVKKKITRELVTLVLSRKPKMCSFLEWKDLKIVYKRYASLYFCCAIEPEDNELLTLEIIHRYVELLDKYFGSVCELDIIFNFEKAFFMLDELMLGGEVQETSKKNVLKAIAAQDLLQEDEAIETALKEYGLT